MNKLQPQTSGGSICWTERYRAQPSELDHPVTWSHCAIFSPVIMNGSACVFANAFVSHLEYLYPAEYNNGVKGEWIVGLREDVTNTDTDKDIRLHSDNPATIRSDKFSRRIILRWIFRKLEGVVGTGWSWLRIGTGGGHLWVRWGTFGFHKCGEFLD